MIRERIGFLSNDGASLLGRVEKLKQDDIKSKRGQRKSLLDSIVQLLCEGTENEFNTAEYWTVPGQTSKYKFDNNFNNNNNNNNNIYINDVEGSCVVFLGIAWMAVRRPASLDSLMVPA